MSILVWVLCKQLCFLLFVSIVIMILFLLLIYTVHHCNTICCKCLQLIFVILFPLWHSSIISFSVLFLHFYICVLTNCHKCAVLITSCVFLHKILFKTSVTVYSFRWNTNPSLFDVNILNIIYWPCLFCFDNENFQIYLLLAANKWSNAPFSCLFPILLVFFNDFGNFAIYCNVHFHTTHDYYYVSHGCFINFSLGFVIFLNLLFHHTYFWNVALNHCYHSTFWLDSCYYFICKGLIIMLRIC